MIAEQYRKFIYAKTFLGASGTLKFCTLVALLVSAAPQLDCSAVRLNNAISICGPFFIIRLPSVECRCVSKWAGTLFFSCL